MPLDQLNTIAVPATRVGGYSPLSALNAAQKNVDLDRKRREEEAAERDAAAVGQVMSQHPEDPDTAIKVLKQTGFHGAAAALQKRVTEERTKMSEFRGQELENLFKTGQVSAQQVEAEYKALTRGREEDWRRLYDIDPEGAMEKAPFMLGAVAGAEMLARFQNAKTAAYQADTSRMQAETDALAETRLGQPKLEEPYTLGPDQRRMLGKEEIARGLPRTFAPQRPAASGAGGQGAAPAANVPPQARGVMARVLTGVPGTQLATVKEEVNRLAAAGDENGLKSYLRYAATNTVGEGRREVMRGRMETLSALKDAETLLKSVPTNMVRGTWEDTMRALGTSSNPQYVQLGSQMGTILANYMRSISGAAVSDNEATRLTPLIPNFRNTLPVNLGVMKGFSEAIKSFDRAFYQNKFGEHYDWVMSPSAPKTAAAAGPKEGDKKPITAPGYPPGAEVTFKGGQWHRTK